jgi:hypothetical protein
LTFPYRTSRSRRCRSRRPDGCVGDRFEHSSSVELGCLLYVISVGAVITDE